MRLTDSSTGWLPAEGRPDEPRVAGDAGERMGAESLRAGEKRILEMIAANAPLEDVLASLMRLIESRSAGMLCSVLLLDEDGLRVRHGAAPSLPEAYIKAIDGSAIGPRAGSCGTAAYRGEPVIVTDILEDPLWADYRHLAAPHGLRACWSTPIFSHGGKVLGTFAMYYREPRSPRPAEMRLTDVATSIAGIAIERRRAEEEVRRLNAELEQRVLDRTAQLEAANRELESFSYTVSHDLRAPLRGIHGWSLAILEDCADRLDARGRAYLERVRTATQRMEKLIDDLLELGHVTGAEMMLRRVDLSALARSIAARLQDAEPGRRVAFVIQPGVTIDGDSRLLEIMLANLLGNAWKFTGKHPSARIEFGRTGQEGRTVHFVRDDGAGFDMASAGRLFTPFHRMHSESEFPGNGIGLATVQRVVHRHGGQVWADAEAEKGTTIYFTL